MSCTAGQKPPPSAASRNLFKSCPSPARWNGSPSRRERLNNQVVPFRSPADPPQCPECCANPRLLCRGTNGSNPSPSSRESCKLSVPLVTTQINYTSPASQSGRTVVDKREVCGGSGFLDGRIS